jgi:hypothetical protein
MGALNMSPCRANWHPLKQSRQGSPPMSYKGYPCVGQRSLEHPHVSVTKRQNYQGQVCAGQPGRSRQPARQTGRPTQKRTPRCRHKGRHRGRRALSRGSGEGRRDPSSTRTPEPSPGQSRRRLRAGGTHRASCDHRGSQAGIAAIEPPRRLPFGSPVCDNLDIRHTVQEPAQSPKPPIRRPR